MLHWIIYMTFFKKITYIKIYIILHHILVKHIPTLKGLQKLHKHVNDNTRLHTHKHSLIILSIGAFTET